MRIIVPTLFLMGLAVLIGGCPAPTDPVTEMPADTTPPVVTSGNVTISSSGTTLAIGDAVTFSWDSSPSGDNNADVTQTSQVTFDLSSFGASQVTPDTVTAGVFSYTHIVGSGSIDATGLSFSVTVTDSSGNVTGPVVSIDSVDMDNESPTVTPSLAAIDNSGATGGGGVLVVNDEVVFTWDNSTSGDYNLDVGDVKFDLSEFGGPSQVDPDLLSAGFFSYTLTIVSGAIDNPTARFSVTVSDDAGNTTGPVTSTDSAAVNNT